MISPRNKTKGYLYRSLGRYQISLTIYVHSRWHFRSNGRGVIPEKIKLLYVFILCERKDISAVIRNGELLCSIKSIMDIA